MLKSTKKISILLNDIYYQLSYRFLANKKPLIIWGRSPYLEFGPGIRTRRFKSIIEKKSINKICIYMQSHWPWYDIVIYTFFAKLLNIKIIFNQNGIYTKQYIRNYKFNNLILIFGILNSDYVIYQSWFCYKSLIKITPYLFKNLINSKNFSRILNPSVNFTSYDNKPIYKKHKIIISNAFRKDISYYSDYIYELSMKLKNLENIEQINIIGNIKQNINEKRLKNLLKVKNIFLISKLDNKGIFEMINKNTIVIHLNYGDACPNFISEVISFGVPCIINNVGGGKEIASKACICQKNKINLNGFLMPRFSDVVKSVNELSINYSKYKKYATNRADKISLKKYVRKHIRIINSL